MIEVSIRFAILGNKNNLSVYCQAIFGSARADNLTCYRRQLSAGLARR